MYLIKSEVMDYRKKISEFVGEGGFCAFEHGFRPSFAMWGVSDTEVYLRRGGRKDIASLTEGQAETVYADLTEYERYCREEA